MTKQQLREIVKQDNARRAARKLAEDTQLGLQMIEAACDAPPNVDPYLWDRSITGVPSAGNRNYKASDDCWKRGLRGRTFGIARDGAPPNTMLVNGNVVPIPTRKRTTHAVVRVARPIAPEVAHLPSIRAGESY